MIKFIQPYPHFKYMGNAWEIPLLSRSETVSSNLDNCDDYVKLVLSSRSHVFTQRKQCSGIAFVGRPAGFHPAQPNTAFWICAGH